MPAALAMAVADSATGSSINISSRESLYDLAFKGRRLISYDELYKYYRYDGVKSRIASFHYDPWDGLRTAAILGALMALMALGMAVCHLRARSSAKRLAAATASWQQQPPPASPPPQPLLAGASTEEAEAAASAAAAVAAAPTAAAAMATLASVEDFGDADGVEEEQEAEEAAAMPMVPLVSRGGDCSLSEEEGECAKLL